ncbi:MAG TPA: cupredoxin domain-containing protein [Nitrospiria bacterium]|nr:cupredoxin domain-containing protein [Nitrospiria bacterium]
MKSNFILMLVFFFTATLAFAEPVEVHLTLRDHRFDPSEVRVKGDDGIKLVVKNEDLSMEEFESPALRKEKKILGGHTLEMSIPFIRPGTYEFYGEYHADTAKGKLIVE